MKIWVRLTKDDKEIGVNFDNVDFIEDFGGKTSIHFNGGEYPIEVDEQFNYVKQAITNRIDDQ